MKEPFDQELLSAYLDGELTAAQQARVERLLAENPKAKQLLDELRALSATLQSLPQEKVGEDLSPYVLRQAERELLTGSRPPGAARLRLRQMLSHMLSRRALAWAAAAVVIAVVFAVSDYYQRRQQGHREVAVGRVPDDASQAARPEGGQRQLDDAAKEAAPRRPPAIHAPGAAGEEDEASAKPSAETSEAPAALKSAERPGGLAGTGVAPTGKEEDLPTERKPAPAMETGAEKPAPKAIGPADSAVAGAGGGRGAVPSQEPAMAGPMLGAKPSSARPEGVTGGSVQTAPPVAAEGRLHPMTPAAGGASFESAQAAAGPEGVLVVRCDITPEAARNRALDQLLVSNNIALEGDSAFAGADQKGTDSRVQGKSPARAPTSRGLVTQQTDAVASSAALSGLDVVYVEAAPEQLEPVLAAINAMPSQFLTVSIEPPPQMQSQRAANLTANQYDFSRYNRAKPAAESQQPSVATQELKAPIAAPAATELRGHAAQYGARPGQPIGYGRSSERQSGGVPSEVGDKAGSAGQDGNARLAGAPGQQFGGSLGRAFRVQLPQKRAPENVLQAVTNGADAGRPPPVPPGTEQPAGQQPLGQGTEGFAGGRMAVKSEPRAGDTLSSKGKSDFEAPAAPPIEAPAPAAKPPAAPPAPTAPGRDRPEQATAESAQADERGEKSKGKPAQTPTGKEQLQQTGNVCRVLFVIRVVPDAPAAQLAEPAAEKSQVPE